MKMNRVLAAAAAGVVMCASGLAFAQAGTGGTNLAPEPSASQAGQAGSAPTISGTTGSSSSREEMSTRGTDTNAQPPAGQKQVPDDSLIKQVEPRR